MITLTRYRYQEHKNKKGWVSKQFKKEEFKEVVYQEIGRAVIATREDLTREVLNVHSHNGYGLEDGVFYAYGCVEVSKPTGKYLYMPKECWEWENK